MKICIYGAGAIGGYLGAELADIGCDVSLIARGPHLRIVRGKKEVALDSRREIDHGSHRRQAECGQPRGQPPGPPGGPEREQRPVRRQAEDAQPNPSSDTA